MLFISHGPTWLEVSASVALGSKCSIRAFVPGHNGCAPRQLLTMASGRLERGEFPTLQAYIYASVWSDFIEAEYHAEHESGDPQDEWKSWYALQQKLECIKEWCVRPQCRLHDLIIDDPLRTAEEVRTLNTTLYAGSLQHQVDAASSAHGLNAAQRRVLLQSIDRRVLLVQGPPGTGKSRTATALVALHQGTGRAVLVSTPSNAAANLLASSLVDEKVAVWRYLSIEAEEGMTPTQKATLASCCLPLAAREMLKAEGYSEDAQKFKKHVNRRCKDIIAQDQRVTVATLSMAAATPVMSDVSHDIVVVDEAAQATEPAVLEAVSVCGHEGCVVQIGDHRQLPATVKCIRSVRAGRSVSMFERLGAIAGMTLELLQEQYRMHPSIAHYPNSAYYEGKLVTRAKATSAPRGYPWPGQDPVVFEHVDGVEKQDGFSYTNMEEASRAIEVALDLVAQGDALASGIGGTVPV